MRNYLQTYWNLEPGAADLVLLHACTIPIQRTPSGHSNEYKSLRSAQAYLDASVVDYARCTGEKNAVDKGEMVCSR